MAVTGCLTEVSGGQEHSDPQDDVALMTPRSRGTVRLADGDPRSAPLVDPAYLTDDHDADVMIAGLRMARRSALLPHWNPGAARRSSPALA